MHVQQCPQQHPIAVVTVTINLPARGLMSRNRKQAITHVRSLFEALPCINRLWMCSKAFWSSNERKIVFGKTASERKALRRRKFYFSSEHSLHPKLVDNACSRVLLCSRVKNKQQEEWKHSTSGRPLRELRKWFQFAVAFHSSRMCWSCSEAPREENNKRV